MLHSIIHDAQIGEDVEGVEAWFKKYEKQQKNRIIHYKYLYLLKF